MLSVKITPNDKGNPPGKLADVELHFTDVRFECPACEGSGEMAIQLASGDHRFEDCSTCKGQRCVTSPLAGLKLIGFAIWERRGTNGRNVTLPARQYSVNGERRSFALLRPVLDIDAQNRLRDLILDAFVAYEERDTTEAV
jgi:hypothetical protein